MSYKYGKEKYSTDKIINYGIEPPINSKPIWGKESPTEDDVIDLIDFQASLQKLTSTEREILSLSTQGYSIREIEEMTNLPSTTVFRIKDRAINKLKEMMNGKDSIFSIFA